MTSKGTIQQILGSLMKHPQFLSEIDKYSLSMTDFSTKFESISSRPFKACGAMARPRLLLSILKAIWKPTRARRSFLKHSLMSPDLI